ncbi:MAG: hypothetical protein US81_C0026G0001, partial [Parcubacteria group bacterium GW2011_GWE2_38_18]
MPCVSLTFAPSPLEEPVLSLTGEEG